MNITGSVKVIDFPDDECLTTVRQLLMDLERYLGIELKVDKITNVFVSTTEPDVPDKDVIWYKIDNSGNFIGQFVYVQGNWIQMFPPPNGIFRMYGDSTDVPSGYALIDEDNPNFTVAMLAHLQSQWLLDPTNTFYVIFDVVYVGL